MQHARRRQICQSAQKVNVNGAASILKGWLTERVDGAEMNSKLNNTLLIIMGIMLAGCASYDYNANYYRSAQSAALLGYGAQMLQPYYGVHTMSYNALPSTIDRSGVVCNTFNGMTFCTEY